MSGHTKGPWGAWVKGGTIQIDNRGGDGRNPSVVNWRGLDGNDLSQRTNKANARLIAAAPDLLEALRSLVENLTEGDFISETRIDAAKAAISRATEAQP
jgi:hypothetical protein